MDEVQKFIKKLPKKEKEAFLLLMLKLKKNHKKVPGIRKLKNKKNLYRVRLGRYRLVFSLGKTITFKKISKRDNQTYKNL